MLSLLSQVQVQMSGNSSVTYRHAPALSIPSFSFIQLIRLPQEKVPSPSVAKAFHTSFVHSVQPHRDSATGDSVVGFVVGARVGTSSSLQAQVQISGNSSVTKRQASSSLKSSIDEIPMSRRVASV